MYYRQPTYRLLSRRQRIHTAFPLQIRQQSPHAVGVVRSAVALPGATVPTDEPYDGEMIGRFLGEVLGYMHKRGMLR